MTPWHNVVLCSSMLGGAEIFALERLVVLGDHGVLRCNPSLKALIVQDARYRGLRILAVDSLEALAAKVGWRNIRRAAAELSPVLQQGGVLLGNLRAASLQLVSPWAHLNTAFIHDNTRDLNAKARWLVAVAAVRSQRVMFPSCNASARLPLRRLVAHKLGVEYFSECRIAPCPQVQATETLRVACVGRIGPDKNQQLAAAIASLLARHFSRVELTLLGSVVDQGYLQRLLELNDQRNLVIAVRQVHRSEILDTLRQHDLVLHTSLIENLPLVMFEAGEAGVPFFAVAAGGIPEMLPAHRLIPPEAHGAAEKVLAQLSRVPQPGLAAQAPAHAIAR